MGVVGVVLEHGHLLFGLVFLVLVVDETRGRFSASSAATSGRLSEVIFLAAGVAMWIATIRANSAPEFVVHSLWADALLVMGSVPSARRAGLLTAPAWALAQPVAVVASGLLLFVHLHGSIAASPGALSHLMMGAALVIAGAGAAAIHLVSAAGRRWSVCAQLPMVVFVALLISYPL